jgi:hypothetical protein
VDVTQKLVSEEFPVTNFPKCLKQFQDENADVGIYPPRLLCGIPSENTWIPVPITFNSMTF